MSIEDQIDEFVKLHFRRLKIVFPHEHYTQTIFRNSPEIVLLRSWDFSTKRQWIKEDKYLYRRIKKLLNQTNPAILLTSPIPWIREWNQNKTK